LVIETSLLETADLRPEILDTKKVEKELTRSLFSASVRVLSVGGLNRGGNRNEAHEVVPVSENRDSNDGTATEQFLIT